MTFFLGICSALACFAWIRAEARGRYLEKRYDELKARYIAKIHGSIANSRRIDG